MIRSLIPSSPGMAEEEVHLVVEEEEEGGDYCSLRLQKTTPPFSFLGWRNMRILSQVL